MTAMIIYSACFISDFTSWWRWRYLAYTFACFVTLFSGLLNYEIDCLQRMQNMDATVIYIFNNISMTPALRTSHWLPVSNQFHNGSTPPFLKQLLTSKRITWSLRSNSGGLTLDNAPLAIIYCACRIHNTRISGRKRSYYWRLICLENNIIN